jgi:hypothetical protein
MTEVMVLTVAESKRLIAKGVANLDIVKKALRHGMIAVAKGTTNGYVVEELLNKRIDKTAYVLGKTLPEKMEGLYSLPAPARDVVLKDGEPVDTSVVESVRSMGEGDVFIKGGNALNYEKGVVGVLMGSLKGGTIGATIDTINRHKINLVLPVGLEKSVVTDVYSIQEELEKNEATWRGAPLRLMPLSGTVVTEIEALEILTGAKAVLVSAGGIGEAEGSIRLLLKGDPEKVRKAAALIADIQGEPPFLTLH